MTRQGLVFVYTGNGKGKTTAALGLALRALGYGQKVMMIQFMKGREYGEVVASDKFLPGLTLYRSGRDSFVDRQNPAPIDIEMAGSGLETAREAVFSGEYDLVILDEINVALDYHLVDLEQIIELIRDKPCHIMLGLTGRNAPLEIIELADLVTEMKEIKHPYYKGIKAQKGFEY